MRIGIDGLLLHGAFSGVEVSIYSLLTELSASGGPHEYSVYVPHDFGAGQLSRPGFRFRRLDFPGGSKLRRAWWSQSRFARRARADGIDLLHGPGYLLPSGWRGLSVVTVYDVIALSHPELCTRANVLYYRAFLPRTLARATAVIVPAEAVKREIVDLLGIDDSKFHVAPLGVGEEFTADLPEEHTRDVAARYGVDGPYLLSVGNIEPKKNLAATIEAFSLAKQRADLPHRLVLAGGKSWRSSDVEAAIERHGPEVVNQTGYVAAEHLPALYAGADAVLFWSLVEGFGLPALEAMACGTPVICSDRGALAEVVGDAAMVVRIGPPEALAEAIVELLGNEVARGELVTRGLERSGRLTWRRHADAVLRTYAEVGDCAE